MSLWWDLLEIAVSTPELGWIFLFGWLFFELHHKRGRIAQLDKKITGSVIVIRALARKEQAIDEQQVDEYLVENGMEPSDFFVEKGGEARPQHFVEDSAEQDDESPLTKSANIPNNDGDTSE